MEWKPLVKQIVGAVLAVFVCFILQTTVFSRLELAGVSPNLMLMLTSFYGFMWGQREGTLVGFFCGLLLDIFFGQYFGMYALIYMTIGFVNGLFRRFFYGDDVKLPLLFVGISDLLYGFIVYGALFLPRGKSEPLSYFMAIMMPEMLYTLILSFILYFAVIQLKRWEEKTEKRGDVRLVR